MWRIAVAAGLLLCSPLANAEEPLPPPPPAPEPPPPAPAPQPAAPPAAPPAPPAAPPAPPGTQPAPPGTQPAPYPPRYNPPYGGPPPGFGPPGMPYGPYAPPVARPPGPATIDYQDGDRIPPGYRLTTRSQKDIAAIGGAILLLGYVPAVYAAAIIGASEINDDFDPLYIPAAGPFITIETADASATGGFWLGLLGLVQTGGLVTGVVGLFLPDKKLLMRMGSAPDAPSLSLGPAGADVHGTF